MEQSPSWEANWFSASQEIPRILWKPKVYYRIIYGITDRNITDAQFICVVTRTRLGWCIV